MPWRWVLAGVLVTVWRFAGTGWAPVDDCDEVFNYWEPLHFLAHGSGMRTWEYW